MGKQARPYQIEFKAAVLKALNKGVKRQLGVLATGTGKSFAAIDIIKDFGKKLWITHEESLLEQSACAALTEYAPQINIRAMIESYGGLTNYIRHIQANPLFSELSENEVMKGVSVIKADVFGLEGDIIFASAQTLYRRLDKINPNLFDVVVADEAHLFGSKTFNQSLQHFDPKLLLGLTATATRMDGMMMGDIFEEIVYQYNIDEAIRDGYLVELDAIQIRTKLNLDNIHTLGGEFNQKELSQTVDVPERNELIYDSYKKYANGKQHIIYCINIEHAQNVNSVFQSHGELSEVLVSDIEITPDKKATLNRFKNEETTHLINVGMATTGVDIPNVQCITPARPTKSETLFWQILGRGTRTLPGIIDGIDDPIMRREAIKRSSKSKCIILDIVDVASKHKLINTYTLDKKKTIEERTFMTSEKKAGLIEIRDKAKIAAVLESDKRIHLFEVPEMKFSNSLRMQEPATEKQLVILKEHGYDTVNVSYTKAMCNQIISNFPASIKQINFLRWKKFDVDACPGLTYGQFQVCLKQVQEAEAAELLRKQTTHGEIEF